MPKWLKTFLGVLLLPLCFGTAQALFQVIQASGNVEAFWIATLTGIACWIVIYLMLPKPMWVYVVGHELTHALWTWLFGGRVIRFRAKASGGHVKVTRMNFLIALAPYFFPIYVLGVVLGFELGNWIWDWTRQRIWFHLLLGLTYAFHITLTWHVLSSRQSDISEQGYLFSAVVIWLGNAVVLILGIASLTGQVDAWTALTWCWIETARFFRHLLAVR
jgi:hypothetical protein